MSGVNSSHMYAVDKFNVGKEVLELHKKNTPGSVISKVLGEKGIKISPLGINRWIKKTRERVNKTRDLEARKEYDVIATNYRKEIVNILEEVKLMKDISKEQGDLKIYDKMVGRLYQGLELLAKLMGDIKSQGSVDINIIINEINKKAFDMNKKMRNHFSDDKIIINAEAEIIEENKTAREKVEVKNE